MSRMKLSSNESLYSSVKESAEKNEVGGRRLDQLCQSEFAANFAPREAPRGRSGHVRPGQAAALDEPVPA